ncbi:hypothetical protein AciX8_3157 [Granulicella mallensis MP5ACTX8]|uniref:Uncharacterized protein n=1 Tax=Granulicella mallensis (strain ATCC BAA-1857 / DSM 23137 / MP5ACTX8) TaxID=682795 RepID=G8NT29_GRAMM|nr:hypothetical protein AciX8_3157 [Granulicella mallensis MP5ACTX8]
MLLNSATILETICLPESHLPPYAMPGFQEARISVAMRTSLG